MRRWLWRVIPLVMFFILAVFMWRGLSLDPKALPSVREGTVLEDFQLPVLYPQPHSGNERPGQWFILNVWASWCEACIEEQSFLLKLHRKGIRLYGLNYKDSAENALHWLRTWGNPYALIWQDYDGRVAIDLGVYGAPESFLIDDKGVIVHRHVGVLDEKSWKNEFVSRIKKYETTI